MTRNPSTVFFTEVLQTTLRSWWTIIAGLCVGLAGGLIAWQYLPKTYEASTSIFVAPSQIPQEFGRSPSVDDMAMRLATLREAVLSRPYMTRLGVEIFGLTPGEAGSDAAQEDLRERIGARIAHFDDRRGSGVVELSFRDGDPQRAARVINLLADHYIEENVRVRRTQATGTTTVLSGLAGGLENELKAREQKIAAFKQANIHTLPENRETNVRLLESRQRDLQDIDGEIGRAQQARDVLAAQAEMAQASPGLVESGVPGRETRAQRIARVQNELRALLDRYTESHPAVKLKKEELARVTSAPQDPDVAGIPGTTISPEDEFGPRVQAADREIARLQNVRAQIQADIRMYQGRLAATPRTDQELSELTKGYDVMLDQYRDYQQKAETARGTEKVEELRKGEQFEVMSRAVPPTKPIRPIPALVIAAGLLLGLVVFLAPVLARAIFAPKVVSREGLKMLSPVPVLISIGQIMTPRERKARARRQLWNWGAVAVSFSLLAAAIAGFLVG